MTKQKCTVKDLNLEDFAVRIIHIHAPVFIWIGPCIIFQHFERLSAVKTSHGYGLMRHCCPLLNC